MRSIEAAICDTSGCRPRSDGFLRATDSGVPVDHLSIFGSQTSLRKKSKELEWPLSENPLHRNFRNAQWIVRLPELHPRGYRLPFRRSQAAIAEPVQRAWPVT